MEFILNITGNGRHFPYKICVILKMETTCTNAE